MDAYPGFATSEIWDRRMSASVKAEPVVARSTTACKFASKKPDDGRPTGRHSQAAKRDSQRRWIDRVSPDIPAGRFPGRRMIQVPHGSG
jgi:hypothetical protein